RMLAKSPIASDIPAMTKASASRNTEIWGAWRLSSRLTASSTSEGAEGSDISLPALRQRFHNADYRSLFSGGLRQRQIVGRPSCEGTKRRIAANKVATHAQTKMKAHWSRVIQD